VYSALWARREFQALSPDARLVYLNLRTGTQSNLAGIGYVYREALVQETGLDTPALEAALGALEKMPTPAASWIVREGPIVWVRDHLNDSPAREDDPNIRNSKHRAAIGYILGGLPADSLIVKKFRRYYNLGTDRVSHAPSRRPSHRVADSPEIGDGDGEGEGEGDRRGGEPRSPDGSLSPSLHSGSPSPTPSNPLRGKERPNGHQAGVESPPENLIAEAVAGLRRTHPNASEDVLRAIARDWLLETKGKPGGWW
jgi:hypothetical protein